MARLDGGCGGTDSDGMVGELDVVSDSPIRYVFTRYGSDANHDGVLPAAKSDWISCDTAAAFVRASASSEDGSAVARTDNTDALPRVSHMRSGWSRWIYELREPEAEAEPLLARVSAQTGSGVSTTAIEYSNLISSDCSFLDVVCSVKEKPARIRAGYGRSHDCSQKARYVKVNHRHGRTATA